MSQPINLSSKSFTELMMYISDNNMQAREMIAINNAEGEYLYRENALEAEELAIKRIIFTDQEKSLLTKVTLCASGAANCVALKKFDQGIRLASIGLSDDRITSHQRLELLHLLEACAAKAHKVEISDDEDQSSTIGISFNGPGQIGYIKFNEIPKRIDALTELVIRECQKLSGKSYDDDDSYQSICKEIEVDMRTPVPASFFTCVKFKSNGKTPGFTDLRFDIDTAVKLVASRLAEISSGKSGDVKDPLDKLYLAAYKRIMPKGRGVKNLYIYNKLGNIEALINRIKKEKKKDIEIKEFIAVSGVLNKPDIFSERIALVQEGKKSITLTIHDKSLLKIFNEYYGKKVDVTYKLLNGKKIVEDIALVDDDDIDSE